MGSKQSVSMNKISVADKVVVLEKEANKIQVNGKSTPPGWDLWLNIWSTVWVGTKCDDVDIINVAEIKIVIC